MSNFAADFVKVQWKVDKHSEPLGAPSNFSSEALDQFVIKGPVVMLRSYMRSWSATIWLRWQHVLLRPPDPGMILLKFLISRWFQRFTIVSPSCHLCCEASLRSLTFRGARGQRFACPSACGYPRSVNIGGSCRGRETTRRANW